MQRPRAVIRVGPSPSAGSSDHPARRAGGRSAARGVAVLPGAAVAAVGVLHLAWSLGATWPATTAEELADAVVGSPGLPGPGACAVVGAAALTAGGVMVREGRGAGARPVTSLVAVALLVRAAAGGRAATRVLGLPSPGRRFLTLDARVYRPLCAALGIAAGLPLVGGALDRPSSPGSRGS